MPVSALHLIYTATFYQGYKRRRWKSFNYYFQHGERDEELLARGHRKDSGKE
jgi:hypothetical protein